MSTTPLSLAQINDFSRDQLIRHGAADWIADLVADAITRAERTGNVVCGLYYLESYCQQLASGRVKGDVEPVVSRPKPSTVLVDAQFGFAQPAFARGLDVALEAARETGTTTFAVAHAHTCTALGYFTEQIAQAGLIALGMTNASACVAPPGATKRVLGTNPFAFAVPNGQGGVAMQFDQSTTAIALGRVTQAIAAGEDIPLGWVIDKDGNPSTNPNDVTQGSMASSGGYKGWGIGLMVEVLAACLTDSTLSAELQPLKAPEGRPHNLGQTYILIDPNSFAGEAFYSRLKMLEESVTSQPGARLPGSTPKTLDPVHVPSALWEKLQNL